MARSIKVNEAYQTGYEYVLTEPMGSNFHSDFKPDLTPPEMLKLGIFGGDYFNEIPDEFPKNWFQEVKLSSKGAQKELNLFKVNASQPLEEWQRKGWVYQEDPHGWFLWYCRYYMGRRVPKEDTRQIKRWQAMTRHVQQIKNACQPGDLECRPRQRQALLHWAYDSRKI